MYEYAKTTVMLVFTDSLQPTPAAYQHATCLRAQLSLDICVYYYTYNTFAYACTYVGTYVGTSVCERTKST